MLLEEKTRPKAKAAGGPIEALASYLMAMIDGIITQQWTDPRIRASETLNTTLP